jgi:hypothetical protein
MFYHCPHPIRDEMVSSEGLVKDGFGDHICVKLDSSEPKPHQIQQGAYWAAPAHTLQQWQELGIILLLDIDLEAKGQPCMRSSSGL